MLHAVQTPDGQRSGLECPPLPVRRVEELVGSFGVLELELLGVPEQLFFGANGDVAHQHHSSEPARMVHEVAARRSSTLAGVNPLLA